MEQRSPARRQYFDDDADAIFLRAIRQKFAAGAAASALGIQFLPTEQFAWAAFGVSAICILTWIVLTVRLRRLRV